MCVEANIVQFQDGSWWVVDIVEGWEPLTVAGPFKSEEEAEEGLLQYCAEVKARYGNIH